MQSALLFLKGYLWLILIQRMGLGERLLAQALRDCHVTGNTIPFIAVLLNAITLEAKSFYRHYDFEELPGHPMTLMLPWNLLDEMMKEI